MKEANVIPILTKGARKLPANYRSISLASNVIRFKQKLLRINQSAILKTVIFLHSFQQGFRKNRSCLEELLDYYNNILNSIVWGKNVAVIYLYFSKAFDKVNHEILIKKVKKLGIAEKLLNWIEE